MNILSLAWSKRPTMDIISKVPKGRMNLPWRPESYLEFFIDGKSLKDLIDTNDGYHDEIGVLGNQFRSEAQIQWQKILLGEEESELETGRVELYVCANCGDIGCGSVTVELLITDDEVTWSDFGHERNYEIDEGDGLIYREGLEHVGPFRFGRRQYREALTAPPQRSKSRR